MRRHIIYIPGMISFSLMLPLFAYKLIVFYSTEKLRVLDITWYVPGDSIHAHMQEPPPRAYSVIEITGDNKADEKKLDAVYTQVNKLAAQNDRLQSIRVHFQPTAKYESFIRTLNFSKKLIQCVPYKDDIWIFIGERKKPRDVQVITCGTLWANRVVTPAMEDHGFLFKFWLSAIPFYFLWL